MPETVELSQLHIEMLLWVGAVMGIAVWLVTWWVIDRVSRL